MTETLIEALERARGWLKAAGRVLVITGAGVSAESGIPTFRGGGAYWSGFSPNELSSVRGFDANPCLVWSWYEERRARVRSAEPNAAHRALAAYTTRADARILTQNVDGLHLRAARGLGTPSAANDPIEFHGSLFKVRCRRCHRPGPNPETIDASSRDTLPRCLRPHCRGLMRPDIVWFGEAIPEENRLLSIKLAREADVCLVIGTSLEVYPVADLPDQTRDTDGKVVEVNVFPVVRGTTNTAANLVGKAGDVVPELLAGLP